MHTHPNDARQPGAETTPAAVKPEKKNKDESSMAKSDMIGV